jgi:hypothetical protein
MLMILHLEKERLEVILEILIPAPRLVIPGMETVTTPKLRMRLVAVTAIPFRTTIQTMAMVPTMPMVNLRLTIHLGVIKLHQADNLETTKRRQTINLETAKLTTIPTAEKTPPTSGILGSKFDVIGYGRVQNTNAHIRRFLLQAI